MKKLYFTITGTKYRHGQDFFKKGMKVRLIKEPDNEFDKVLFLTLYKVQSAEISHTKKSLIGKDSNAYCARFFAGRGFYVIIADCCNQKAGTPNRPKFQFLLNQFSQAGMLPSLPNTFMITILCRTDKPLSQKIYDSIVDSIDIQQIRCCCGHAGTLIHHGSYRRSVKTPNGLLTLRIIRVKCSYCGKTHALLLSGIVPYSRISLRDQAEIIECHLGNGIMSRLLDRCPSIDENNVKYVIRQYCRHWKERLLSESLFTSRIPDLVVGCFRAFSQQFMQVHSTVNRLFQTPT